MLESLESRLADSDEDLQQLNSLRSLQFVKLEDCAYLLNKIS